MDKINLNWSQAIFDRAFEELIGLEGGYVNDPDDLGSETKFGISKRWYPNEDIKNLTLGRAKDIYWHDFWKLLHLPAVINEEIAKEIFEQSVNLGRQQATEHTQRALNMVTAGQRLEIDGMFGPKTLAVLNGCSYEQAWLRVMNGLQFVKYLNIIEGNPSQQKFFRGWLKRITF
jgi:lysozyme family protein